MNLGDFYGEMARTPDEMYRMFSRKAGKYPIDAVLTSRTMAVDNIASCLSDNRRRYTMPVHNFEPLVSTDRVTSEGLKKAMVNGYVTGYTWFLNQDEKDKANKQVRKFVSPATFLKADEKNYVRGLPMNIEELDRYCDLPKNDKFSLFWGARMSSEKYPEMTAELMEKFFSFGRDVELRMTT